MKKTLQNIRLFLFDMDGTLYLGNRLFSFTKELLATIRAQGKQYLFLTNNSAKSVKDYVTKLSAMGIEASPEDFFTSSQATAYYLHQHHPGKRLYVCGTRSLQQELIDQGFCVVDDPDKTDCIVMGNDTELTFQKLKDVSYLLLTRPQIPYIATNPDLVCPTEFGSVPDCGSVCQMLEHVSGRLPVVVGKPQPLMPQLAMEMAGCAPEETAVVGDRIYTDIQSGFHAGTVTVLVLSGETTPAMLEASLQKPHVVLNSGQELLTLLQTDPQPMR